MSDTIALPIATREGTTAASVGPGDTTWRNAAARNLAGAWLVPAEAQRRRIRRDPTVWATDAASPQPLLNSATLLRPLTREEAPALVARLGEFYTADHGGAWALWSAWPTPDLRAFGGTLIGQPPLMVRPPGPFPPPPTELTIREVANAPALADFERIFIDGYPIPELQPFRPGTLFTPPVLGGNYRLWLGYVAGRPVTCAISYVSDGVVGIHFVATLPEARGRGYGAAITARAASADPALPALLQASDLGRPVYERLDFTVVGRFDLWFFPRDEH